MKARTEAFLWGLNTQRLQERTILKSPIFKDQKTDKAFR